MKVIPSNSKTHLIDLYVSDRSDNFEYLSSTMILKKLQCQMCLD